MFVRREFKMTDEIVRLLNEAHGSVFTAILIFCVVVDTGLALKSRLPKGLFLSKSLLMGAGYNLFIATVPLLCDVLSRTQYINQADSMIIRILMVIVFVAVLFGVVGSCIANYAVAFPNAKFAWKIAEKLIPHELKKKLERVEGDKNGEDTDK